MVCVVRGACLCAMCLRVVCGVLCDGVWMLCAVVVIVCLCEYVCVC